MDDCSQIKDQDLCNSVSVDLPNFYCFKADIISEDYNDEDSTRCLPFPTGAEMQKFDFSFVNGCLKEFFSFYGKTLDDFGPYIIQGIEEQLMKPGKEFYSTGETIKIYPGSLSSVDLDILKSDNTCNYYFYGRHAKNPSRSYNNIEDKNICFNARKFNEFKNLIDCGFATITFNIGGQNYEIHTCYYVPTVNVPEEFNKAYMEYNNLLYIDVLLNDIVLTSAGRTNYDPIDINNSGRRALDFTYDIKVENKYGRQIEFSSSNDNTFNVIEEGELGPEEKLESENGGNKISFSIINKILLLILLIGF